MRPNRLLLHLVLLPLASALTQQHRKLRHWFPYYEYHFTKVSQSCKAQLDAYHNDNRTLCVSPCACAVDCLLNNTHESIKSNMASAQILIGLTPHILIFVGPSIGDIAVLSTYRPLLAMILSIGFPAMSITSLFTSVDVSKILQRPVTQTGRAYHKWLDGRRRTTQGLIHASIYVVGACAAAINMYLAIYIDMRTVAGWRCGAMYMPLAWSMSGLVPGVVAMFAIRTRKIGHSGAATPSQHDVPECILPAAQNVCATEIIFCLASFLAFAQMVFGIVVFSSLLFLSFLDALPILVWYGASACLCHSLLLIELNGMRINLERRRQGSRQRFEL